MGDFFVSDAPLFTGDAAEIGTVVDLGLVEGEGLRDRTLTETVAVANLHIDGIGACLGVIVTHFLQGRVCGAVQDPHRVCTRLWGIGGNHLVCLLINADVEVNTAY